MFSLLCSSWSGHKFLNYIFIIIFEDFDNPINLKYISKYLGINRKIFVEEIKYLRILVKN